MCYSVKLYNPHWTSKTDILGSFIMYAELSPAELTEESEAFALDLQSFICWQKHLSLLIRL